MIQSPINIREQEIRDTTIEFRSAKKEDDVLIRCTVKNCELILEEPCWVGFASCSFENCTIIAKKECSQMWRGSRWINCNFVGEFGFGFGDRNEDCSLPPGPMVVGCDFSQAVCEITLSNADLPTIKFPRWPNITILEPGLHKAELRVLTFSKMIQGWWFSFTDCFHESYSSLTLNWDKLVKRKREFKAGPKDFQPYEDEVRSTLGRLPYVIM